MRYGLSILTQDFQNLLLDKELFRLGDIPNFLTNRYTSRYGKSITIHESIHDIKTHNVCRTWSKNLSKTILTTYFNPGSTACSSWSESIAGSSVLVRGIEKASLKDGVDGDRFEFGDLVQEDQIERVRHLPIHDTTFNLPNRYTI